MDIKAGSNVGQAAIAPIDTGAMRAAPIPVTHSKALIASVSPRAAVQQPESRASIAQVNEALQNINKTMQSLSADLEFSVDAETGRSIVKVTDKQTGEIIRQMPSKEALEIAKALDKVEGLLIRHKV